MPEPAEELRIADVLRHYGALTVPEGVGWRSMNCPFHGDSHASGRVNVELGAFKCHGCDMSGDAIKLIRLKEDLDYGEAVEFSGKVLGKSHEGISRATDKQKQRKPLGRDRWKTILD